MARIRSQNDIILSLIEFFRTAQPNLDTKPGTVARDILVDSSGAQLGRLYQELERISTLQSLRLALGNDLDRLGSNYGATRRQGTKSSGPALLTFASIDTDISINRGNTITSRNGSTFIIQTSLVVSPVFANSYRAIASQFRNDLDLAGITDTFAVQVLVESGAPGIQGNISKYNLATTDIANVTNVTNASPFGGGTLAEDDAAFRSRILAVFSGANTGTALGYKNAVLEDPAALDAKVIEPGDTLMTRDGTQVGTDSNGNTVILSNGTGGKVDIYAFGSRLQEITDTFIYADKSNTGDATNPANDFVIGQIDADDGKTVTQKRLDNLETRVLPNQPANNIIQVSGSVSGANFVAKSTDSLGRVSGNYELLKDSGAFAGSPWGFDKLHWISNTIDGLPEDKTKGPFNGQDALTFTSIQDIGGGTQRVNVVNENSTVNQTDRTSIQLAHKPMTNVSRVFNATTGERYVIVNQNPDTTSGFNTTGRVVISGSSLPAVSDTLQVDYTWILSFDPNIDYDSKSSNLNSNPRVVQNSVDWGYSNAVRREEATLIANGSVLTATVTHPISAVVSANVITQNTSSVSLVNGRLSVVVPVSIANVVSVIRDSDGTDLWNTSKANGTFSGFTIFLPTDGLATFGDSVSVTYNAVDVFNADGYQGSFDNNTITIVPTTTAVAGMIVEVNYIANVNVLLPATTISNLPAIRNGNGFDTVSSTDVGVQPTTHIFDGSSNIVQNLRQAPSNIGLSIAGSISPGIITITGTTLTGVFDAVFSIGTGGLTVQLSQAIRKALNLASTASIPGNLLVSRVTKVEKVQANSSFQVLSVDNVYDIKGYQLRDNSFFKSESVQNTSLTGTQFILPATDDNESNKPQVGDKLRVTFYYSLSSDTENVSFSKSGTLYSNKRFAIINSLAVSSGFTSTPSSSATLTLLNLNQPSTGVRYQSTYDYTAPQPNERITIRFNQNTLISSATLSVENTRPITADVLVKESVSIQVNITMNIVVTSDFTNNTLTVQQNVQDALTSALNATSLNTIVDASDLVVVAQNVNGVDRARVLFFNKVGKAGSVLSISAGENEYIQASSVIVNIETR